MFTKHVSRHLAAYFDNEFSTEKARFLETHLAGCQRCRAESIQVRWAMSMLDELPAAAAPERIWTSIEAALGERRSPQTFWHWRPALAAAIVCAVLVWVGIRRSGTATDVVRMEGTRAMGAGEWIETGSGSGVTLKVGELGSVELAPNTRLRVVTARQSEHRLSLARGTIHAKISAPPRLFFVDTASGTAIDLGCEYSLSSDEEGTGLLQVTRGWVSFEWKGMESLVPAGASCRTRSQAGPGVPYFDDAPENLKQALEQFSGGKVDGAPLDIILDAARVRDTLTLWHLLTRVELPDRERVFDRIAALTPVPAGVSRQAVLALDPNTLARWKDELAWTW